MCGIAGAIDLSGQREFSTSRLLAMTKAIAHRGPDDEHFHIEPGLALGARRLSIRDLAHGRQPLSNPAETIWAAFNGEIFNYKELRQTLLQKGHPLKSQCDTESWIYLYEDFGDQLFDYVKGQFAVSLWDRNNRTLLLGRDRMGICPLYYAQSDGWLLWASEIKGLFASGLIDADPDHKGIDFLFNFFSASMNRTYFKGIYLLPPGHFIRIKNNSIDLKQYWDLSFPDKDDERIASDPNIIRDELDSLIDQSIARRLQSDVPVVSYLSGGLDSAVVLSHSSKQLKNGNGIPAFTIGMDAGSGPDELRETKITAEATASPLTVVPLNSEKIAASFPEFILASEGPVLDTSCAALMQLAEAVHKQGYKVALTGEGADEALAGYFWFKTQQLNNQLSQWIGPNIPRLSRKLMQRSVSRRIHSLDTPDKGIKGARPAQQYMYETVGLAREKLYSQNMWQHLIGHDPYQDLDITHPQFAKWHPLNQSLYVGYKVMLSGLLMIAKGDRIAMRSSVEMRYPFLDEDVVEFCASIAPSYKLRGLKEKWILREVAKKSLPHSIANRPKTMFRSSLSHTFLNASRPHWVDQLLSPESIKKSGYFDYLAISHYRKMLTTYPRILPIQHVMDAGITTAITTQLWHHLYCGGGLCDLPTWQGPVIRS